MGTPRPLPPDAIAEGHSAAGVVGTPTPAAGERPEWIPLPDYAAVLLGRIAFYASWLDDTLGAIVAASSLERSEDSAHTPDWAASGGRLVKALQSIDVGNTQVNGLAHQLGTNLARLNPTRNQLLHGVWMWREDAVFVAKRSLVSGPRHVSYARYTYAELSRVIESYQQLGNLADRFLEMLRQQNPAVAIRERDATPVCPVDGELLDGAFLEEEVLWRCPKCGQTRSATP